MTMRSEDVTKLSIGSAKVTISAGDSIFTLDAVRCLIEASDEVIQHSSVDGRAYNVCVGKTFHIEAFGDEFTSTGPSLRVWKVLG